MCSPLPHTPVPSSSCRRPRASPAGQDRRPQPLSSVQLRSLCRVSLPELDSMKSVQAHAVKRLVRTDPEWMTGGKVATYHPQRETPRSQETTGLPARGRRKAEVWERLSGATRPPRAHGATRARPWGRQTALVPGAQGQPVRRPLWKVRAHTSQSLAPAAEAMAWSFLWFSLF